MIISISGTQSAIIEILSLLDKNFKIPWGCHKCRHLPFNIKTNCNKMICDRFNCEEEIYWIYNYRLEIDYDGTQIAFSKIINKDGPNSNILSGTVR